MLSPTARSKRTGRECRRREAWQAVGRLHNAAIVPGNSIRDTGRFCHAGETVRASQSRRERGAAWEKQWNVFYRDFTQSWVSFRDSLHTYGNCPSFVSRSIWLSSMKRSRRDFSTADYESDSLNVLASSRDIIRIFYFRISILIELQSWKSITFISRETRFTHSKEKEFRYSEWTI